jgi:hypothetical protein
MAFFGLRFGREVTRNTDARLIHGFRFDNFQSNFVTNAKKGFFPLHMFVLWQNEASNVEPRLAPPRNGTWVIVVDRTPSLPIPATQSFSPFKNI